MWQTPKTDWTVQPRVNGAYMGDWLRVADYERIRGNVLHLAGLYGVALPVPMAPQGITMEGPEEDVFNALESCLAKLGEKAPHGMVETKSWAGNGAAPTVEDWNRWELACAHLYGYNFASWRFLPFRLKGSGFKWR